MATVDVNALQLSPLVRSLIPSMYGAVRQNMSASAFERAVRAGGGSIGRRTLFLEAYRGVRANVQASQRITYANRNYAPGLHPTSLIPNRVNSIHKYQAVIEVRGTGGERRYITVAYDDPTMTKGDLVDLGVEIADEEIYTAATEGGAAVAWTGGVWVEGRVRVGD